MALVKPVIFQVVGYQNSGKTTITMKLIQSLSAHGLKTVTLKHHGHGGKPDVPQEKDSARHISAGAVATLVDGAGRLLLQADHVVSSLEEKIKLLQFFDPDVILIEGYKHKPFPKLLILRDLADLHLLTETPNVKLILYWDETLKARLMEQEDIPVYSINNETVTARTCEVILELIQANTST